MGQYTWVVVETYAARGERSPREIRAKPVPGQGLDTKMNVECSEAMRNKYPPGTYLRLKAKVTNREGGPPFLVPWVALRSLVKGSSREADPRPTVRRSLRESRGASRAVGTKSRYTSVCVHAQSKGT